MSANLKNSAVARDWKRSVFIPIPKKGNAKECSNYRTIALISHASKIMPNFVQPCFSSTWTINFQRFKLFFEKSEEAEIKWPASAGSSIKQGGSRKGSTSAFFIFPKTLTLWIIINFGEFWNRWGYQNSWPDSWEASMQLRRSSLNRTWNDCFHIGKGVCQGCILSLCLFNIYAEYLMRNTVLDEAQAAIKFSRRNNLRYADDITLMAKREKLNSHLMKSKEESEMLA